MYGNLQLGDQEINVDGDKYYLKNFKLHSKDPREKSEPYNFKMEYLFDSERNRMSFLLPDDQPNGMSAKFFVEAEVHQDFELDDGKITQHKTDDLSVFGYVKNASVTLDLSHYR